MKNENANSRAVFTKVIAAGLAMLALQAGCMTLEQMAPPVGVEFQRVAQRQHVDLPTLELGRRVYLLDCARCHSVEPISRYSESHWREILPRMGRESRLDAKDQAAVTAYIMAAHAFLDQESTKLVSVENTEAN